MEISMSSSDPARHGADSANDGQACGPLPEGIASVKPDEAAATDVSDRRLSPRRKKLLRIAVRNGSTDATVSGWVLDRSLGGMCIEAQQPVEAGSLLAVRRQSAPESVPWVDRRVLHVREQENTWELGCEYVRTPNWEVLLQFE
jgi:hypothetical protein